MKKTNNHFTLKTKDLIFKLWLQLNRKRKRQILILLIIMILTGFAEMLLIGCLLPFLTLLTNPNSSLDSTYFIIISSIFKINSTTEKLFITSIILIIAASIAFLARIVNSWFSCKISAGIGYDLSCEVFKRTIYQPYKVHLKRNTSNILSTISKETSSTAIVIQSMLNMLTSLIIIIFLVSAMMIVNLQIALYSFLFYTIAYKLIINSANSRLSENSKKISSSIRNQIKTVQEGIGGIRDVILDNSQESYLKQYRKSDFILRESEAQSNLIKTLPRYFFEAFIIILLALICTISIIYKGFENNNIIAILGIFAVGAQKLLPAFQIIFTSWGNIRDCSVPVNSVLNLASQSLIKIKNIKAIKPLHFKKEIIFKNINFKYQLNGPSILKDINFKIKKGEHIGIIGKTGSGKSTLLDIIMGLIGPTSGSIYIDKEINSNKLDPRLMMWWRSRIAHVPQNIFLMDDSISANIALNFNNNDIDHKRIKAVSEKAQIASFIESSKNGYNQFVGERGIKLSGGQKQRIGIARALYKDFSILVLDEATSALDTNTESKIMDQIYKLDKDITIITVAHRERTLRSCDRVLEIKNGFINEV